jgi:chromate reductase, NAD(P)H dehydrogenase (quinone)
LEENDLMDKVKILGIAGSLRKGSYNKMLLRAAEGLVPADAQMNTFDIGGILPYNQDLEDNPNEALKEFKAEIRAADALLIVTPEYNYSIPGVLKNAIDSASRPYQDKVFDGKPVAIMGASMGMLGSARAQYHLRQSFIFLNMHPLNRPEVMVSFAQDAFDENGQLINEKTKNLVEQLLAALVEWTRRLKCGNT